MNVKNELIEHLLAYDVIVEAEKITKKKYDTDSMTQRVAALNMVKRSQKLTKELRATEDSWKGMKYLDYVNMVMSLGFRPVFNETFEGKGYTEKPLTEVLLALYHETKGILVVTESFGGSMLNFADMYYNWVPNQLDGDWQRAISSGGFEKQGLVWAGRHSVSEAMKYKMDLLHRKGYFAQQWVEAPPSIWLVNYMEANKCDKDYTKYKEIINSKLAKFPEHIRKSILA